MLVLLSIVVAVAVTVADLVSGVAVVLGAAVACSLPRLIGVLRASLGGSALALWTRAL